MVESMATCWSLKTGFLLTLLLALSGCVQPEQATDPTAPLLLPEDIYLEAARQGAAVYRIHTPESVVLIRVGKAGKLKRLGHDHVIASEDIQGLVMLGDESAESRADLLVPLQRLIVDKPEYRTQLGLENEMPESAIEGTTSNMQDKVLESAIYPWVQISARIQSAQTDPPTLKVSMALHGATFEYLVPVDLQIDANQLVIRGDMKMQHEDFDLEPFSAAGGLLKVAEQLELQFTLVAKRL